MGAAIDIETMTRRALLWLTALAFGVVSCAQEPPTPAVAVRLDRIFADWNRPDAPGCGLGMSRDGRIVYERG